MAERSQGQEPEEDEKMHQYKVVLIGDVSGKTAILVRYIDGRYAACLHITLGVEYTVKVLKWNKSTKIRVHVWDIGAGVSPRFEVQRSDSEYDKFFQLYFRGAVGALVVFDVTRADSFQVAQQWKKYLDRVVSSPSGKPLPAVLLANKCDKDRQHIKVDLSQLDDYCRDAGFLHWFRTSAKENFGIDEAFRCLITELCECHNGQNSEAAKECVTTMYGRVLSKSKQPSNEI